MVSDRLSVIGLTMMDGIDWSDYASVPPARQRRASKATRLNPAGSWFECPLGYFPY
jgi:hypothetical protein